MRNRAIRALAWLSVPAAAIAVGTSPAHANVDSTAPSVPAGVHQIGSDRPWSESSVAWTASTDDSGAVSFYWVRNLNLGSRSRPSGTSLPVKSLLIPYCSVPVGTTIRVTVQAVDAAGNVSAPSSPIDVKIN